MDRHDGRTGSATGDQIAIGFPIDSSCSDMIIVVHVAILVVVIVVIALTLEELAQVVRNVCCVSGPRSAST